MISTFADWELDDDPERVDVEAVWSFLSRDAYWGRWRTREILDQQLANSWRVVGAYDATDGALAGFARAMSDGFGAAYLADVFIRQDLRGRKLGEALVDFMIIEGPGKDFRWMLHTGDAHEFYRKLGFREPGPQYMERPSPLRYPDNDRDNLGSGEGVRSFPVRR